MHNVNFCFLLDAKQLLLRVAERKSLAVDKQRKWTTEVYKNDYSRIKFQYRVVCEEHYYGSSCTSYCKPKDDSFGHYLCNNEGKKICLDGWTGPVCNIGKEG